MNKTFHSIWNASKQAWVATAETVSAKGKPTSGAKVAAIVASLMGSLLGSMAHAQTAPPPNTLPTGGQVSAGQASIGQAGANMLIQQASNRAAINWQSFNVGSNAQVQYVQPDASSVTLNRVLGSDPSQIFGRITANGQVVLSNPAGVYFAPDARVDVGGLTATTLGMSDADFMAGSNRYQRNGSSASVVNEGELKASLGGYIALLAPEVRNQGAVIAQMGAVAMASGEVVELRFDNSKHLTGIRVEPSQIQALVDNRHAVQAPGGLVILSAQSLDRLVGGVVSSSGAIEANGLQSEGGRIVLSASSKVSHSGTLDVSSSTAQGGSVSLQGDTIELQTGSRIDATGATGGGTVLVGGNWQGSADPLLQATEQPTQAATTVTMAAAASIDASATQLGNGGKVVLWSDINNANSVTTAQGSVLAMGGAQGGNGGQVETSGHSVDTTHLSVNAGAERGTGGLWLIDPYDYVISSATGINTSLNNGTSVTIDTANASNSYLGSSGSGTITISDNIAKSSGAAATLTLNAANYIDGSGNISSSGNALGVVFNAGGGTGIYTGLISGNVSVTKSGAGNLSLTATNTYTGGTTLSVGTLGVYNNTAMGSGALTVSGNSNLLLGRSVSSIANNLTLNATLSVSYDSNVEYLVVSAGGGGGGGSYTGGGGGGGGGGQVLTGITTLAGSSSTTVTVGAGGAGGFSGNYWAGWGGGAGAGGSTSSLGSVVIASGGAGSWMGLADNISGSAWTNGTGGTGGASGSGYAGGTKSTDTGGGAGGGGGGAGGAGASAFGTGAGGVGGIGVSSRITGSLVTYGAGGTGGTGGGADHAGSSGAANTGQGGMGGSGYYNAHAYPYPDVGGDGGSGVVYVRYLGSSAGTGGTVTAGSGTATGYTLHSFTSTGSSTLAFNALGTTFSGNISGTGGMAVNGGSGSQITLTGANTNTGTTTVSSGTLQVGSGGTTGTLSAGAVVNNAALVFNRSNALAVTGAISGSGTLTQSGSGTTTLTGNNSYTGATTISAGTMQVGSGGTSGTLGTGAVTDNGTLVFNRSDDVTVSNAISGSGTLTTSGSGTLTLTANNTYAGATTISAGTLVLKNNAPSPSNKTFNGSGALRIEPASTSFSSAFSTSGWTLASTLSGLTLGKSGNTQDITIANATSIAGPISLYGGNIAINAGLRATGSNTITLAGSGTVTDGASGYVSASNLLLTGGSVTLDSTSNAIGTLAASGVSGLTYVDSNALTIGTVGSTGGVSATGAVSMTTNNGDLTISQNVSTSDTGATALVLNAGKSASPVTGTSDTSGNIVLSGSPTVTAGTGGTVKLYSGSIANSTGLSSLVSTGSESYFRYHADETTDFSTGSWLNLGAGKSYVIYREQPTVSVGISSQTITYGDTLTNAFTLSGSQNGDTFAQAFASAPAVTVDGGTSTSGNYVAGVHTLSSNSSLTSRLGYAVSSSIASGTLTVNQKALTYSGTAVTRDYDGTRTATVTDAISGQVGADTVLVSSTGALFDTKDAGTGTKTVTVSGVGISGTDSGNYSIASTATVSGATIGKKAITLSASKTYDGTTGLSGAVTLGSLVGSETLTYTGATTSDAHVLTSGKYINAITLADASDSSGGLASNYRLPALNAANAAVTINAKALTSNASITAVAKNYDGTLAATGSTVSGSVLGAVSGDTISLDTSGLTLAYNNAHVATANKTISASGSVGFNIGSSPHASVASDYSFSAPTIAAVTGTITAATLTPTLINTGVSKTYDGNTDAPSGFTPSWSFSGLVSGDTTASLSSTGAAYDSQNVASASKVTVSGLGIASITGSRSSAVTDYALSATSQAVAANITAKRLTISGLAAANKTYDGMDGVSISNWGAVSTGVGSETLTLNHGTAAFTNVNAGTRTVSATGYSLADGSGGGLASNYQLSSTTATTTATIAKATLTVKANNDAKFVTQSDTASYNGVSYSGFVHGETSSVLSGSASVTRSNAVVNAAGSYSGVLDASGSTLSASNYQFSYVEGNYTIVPSSQLLVRVANGSQAYGTAASYNITSAEYYNGSAVVLLSSIANNGGGSFTVSDGSAGGSATFTVGPTGSNITSTAGLTKVASYQLGATITANANPGNYSNTFVVVGANQVNAKGVMASATGVTKTYDGTPDMTGVSLNLATVEANDVVTVNGSGAFASKNVGMGLGYTLSSLQLSGADAGNYYLSGGTNFSGNNGAITARPLTVSYTASNKNYDGSTTATVTASDNRVSGDVLTLSQSAAFADKNVGTGKTVGVSGISIGGTDAANYIVANDNQAAQTTADITRLSSVSWVGGATGNWLDPANWAGGAVPDLSNVAHVLIPQGVNVSFGSTVVAPAQSGPVNIESLRGADGSLTQSAGTLNVGQGGVTLNSYSQSGGALTSLGPILLASLAQTGGSLSTGGDLTVTQDFSQGTSGSITVGGDTRITDTSGGTQIGNLNTTGSTQITSTGGGIAQAADTAVVSGGATHLVATNNGVAANIALNGASNDFQAAVNASGANVSLTDANALTLGTVNATGNLTLNSTGALNLGSSTVGGNLAANSGNGNITQSGTLSVKGSSNLYAGTGNVTLTNPGNDFVGAVSASGTNVALTDADALTLGTVNATGNLTLNSTGALNLGTSTVGGNLVANSGNGRITQSGALLVNGSSNLNAGMGNVTLIHADNDFVGAVSASGTNVALTDNNALTLGTVNATGNLNVNSTGTLNLGTSTVDGNLAVNSGNGIVTQIGALSVMGLAALDAGSGTVLLPRADNQLRGGVQVRASSANVVGDARAAASNATSRVQSSQTVASTAGTWLSNANAPAPLAMASGSSGGAGSGSSAPAAANGNSTGVTVDVSGGAQQSAPLMVAVSLPKATSTAGTGFSFEMPETVKELVTPNTALGITQSNGTPLPVWLRFDEATMRFEATAVPDSALPMQLQVNVGDQRVQVVISERTE